MLNDIYSNPEKFGLTLVAEIKYSLAWYEFDLRVAWVDKDNNLYTARDSGCSCPSPFEAFELDDLEQISVEQLKDRVSAESKEDSTYAGPKDAKLFMRNVKSALEVKKNDE